MTYKEFIENILNTRGRFSCGDEYHERHHIKPRCMNGGDEDDNLIDLYAREHFEAHRLLAQENPENSSLVYAWTCMAFVRGGNVQQYELTKEEYEEARIALSKTVSRSNRNRKWSQESKQKLSESQRGNKNKMYGRPWWDEHTPQEKINQWRINLTNLHPTIAVVQLTKQDEFVAEYQSVREASEKTGIQEPNIIQVYNHTPHRKTAGGYKWMKKSEYLTQEKTTRREYT